MTKKKRRRDWLGLDIDSDDSFDPIGELDLPDDPLGLDEPIYYEDDEDDE